MSLVSLREGILSSIILRRHLVCFVDDVRDITQVAEIIEELDQQLRWQLCELTDINSLSSIDPENGIVVIRYWKMDRKFQSSLGTWLHRFPGSVVLVCEDDVDILPYLRHQFLYACGRITSTEASPNGPVSGDFSPNVSVDEYDNILSSVNQVYIHYTIRRYILDIIIHIRMHRLCRSSQSGGAHSNSLQDMILLSRWLAFKSGSRFVTPEIIQEASLQYFPWHLLIIQDSEYEESILYGSQKELVDDLISRFDKFGMKMADEYQNPLFKQMCIVQNVLKKVVSAT